MLHIQRIHFIERYFIFFSCYLSNICTLLKGIFFYATYPRYIHTIERHFSFILPRCKVFIMRQQIQILVKKPHKHVLIFMHFLHSRPKTQIPRPKSCFFGTLFQLLQTVHTLKMAAICAQIRSTSPISQNHAQMPLRHFTEHLVGGCLDMKKLGTGAMQHAHAFQNIEQAYSHPLRPPNLSKQSWIHI